MQTIKHIGKCFNKGRESVQICVVVLGRLKSSNFSYIDYISFRLIVKFIFGKLAVVVLCLVYENLCFLAFCCC